jgi:hypothetical protein
MAAELSGVSLFGLSEDEVRNLAGAAAKVIAARGKLPAVEKKIAKRGPWTNFSMVLATVYGPRLVMLWKLWETERTRQKKRLVVISREETTDPDVPGVDPDKAVN